MFELIQSYIPVLRWQDIVDILVVAYIIYRVILLIRGTRAVQMAAGLALITMVYFAARWLQLYTLHWILGTILSSLFLLIVIIFQDDIRRALTQMGQTPFIRMRIKTFHTLEEVAKAASNLSETRTGALIVMERRVGLKDHIDSGVILDAEVSKQLLVSIFNKNSPLHDGAVIIQKGKLAVAGCVLPLSTSPYIEKELGTRHRAAIGITEQTDAVAVVISEETGAISVAMNGKLTRNIDSGTLRRILHNAFSIEDNHRPWWRRRLLG